MKRIALFSVSFLVLRPMPTILLLTVPALFIRGNEKEITVQLSNNADRPALAQASAG